MAKSATFGLFVRELPQSRKPLFLLRPRRRSRSARAIPPRHRSPALAAEVARACSRHFKFHTSKALSGSPNARMTIPGLFLAAGTRTFGSLLPGRRGVERRTHAAIVCFHHVVRTLRADEDDAMEETMIAEYARQLLEAHGERAVAEAAQRAVECERRKDEEGAKTWRHVEVALKAMRGPRAT
jgi:hypothetical protein